MHVAVAAPETTRSVWQPYLRRDTPQKAISVFCCTSYDLAINIPGGGCKGFRASGFAFLCSPVWAFHLETTTERSTGKRGTCLLGFPHEPASGIAVTCYLGFALPAHLV